MALHLIIAFEDRALRDICQSDTATAAEFGSELGELLQDRLADMVAAQVLSELVVGNCRSDPGDPATFILDLGKSSLLRFKATDKHSRGRAAEAVDKSRVSRVKVISVET